METITATAKTPLTDNQFDRVVGEIKHTRQLLNTEMAYREDLRKQDAIERYTAHIAHLQDMLENGWVKPVSSCA